MNREECAFLLKRIEALDTRMRTDAEEFMARRDAWMGVIGNLTVSDAIAAAERYYRNETRYSIKPGDVVALVPRRKPPREPEDGLVGVPSDFKERAEFFREWWRGQRIPVTEEEWRWVSQEGHPIGEPPHLIGQDR
jgi:hypothetical protein